MRALAPLPFTSLTSLLHSDKKPGDVPSRQLIIELLLVLFDLYPSDPATGLVRWPGDRPDWRRRPVYPLPEGEWKSAPEMVRCLMIGEDKDKDVVEFVRAARRPQIFKNYLAEMSDVWCVDQRFESQHLAGPADLPPCQPRLLLDVLPREWDLEAGRD